MQNRPVFQFVRLRPRIVISVHPYQQWNVFSAFDPSKCTHTWSSGRTHTLGAVGTDTHTWSSGHTHTYTPGAVGTHTDTHTWSSGHTHRHTHVEQWAHTHTHTWSSGHCSLRRSSSTTTACNFIQDSLVLNTLNYINIYYRTIISPINI